MDYKLKALKNGYEKNHKSWRLLHFILSGFILLLCCIFSDNVFSTYISAVVFIQFYVIYLCNDSNLVWKYVFVHYYVSTALLSVFLCDTTTTNLIELGSVTHYGGAFPMNVLYYWLLLMLIMYFDKKFRKKNGCRCI